MAARRTYWHLESLQRKPTSLRRSTPGGCSIIRKKASNCPTPGAAWYERYQRGSALKSERLGPLSDPRETTYTAYVELQRSREAYVDGLLRSIEDTDYDRELSREWVATLERVLPTLRFPMHGLQMLAAYIGHLAPAGRIVIAAMLQTGDEVRRIQRIAYRMRQLQETHAQFGVEQQSAVAGRSRVAAAAFAHRKAARHV